MVCLLASHYANNGVLTDFQRLRPEGDGEGGVIVSRFLPENSSMVSMSPFSHFYMNDACRTSPIMFVQQECGSPAGLSLVVSKPLASTSYIRL